ncbi:MAG: sigma 54-interacting transcriptional regulator [Candidatus Sumerlaeia bacterium]|nr:sigma 54-interacting transcriptional regulator [Candidatus Sumerlaeia bacterium]
MGCLFVATQQPDLTALPGISEAIGQINAQIQKVAQNAQPVFITGEQGTEKAFAAKLIHAMSPRANKALYKVSVTNTLPSDFGMRFRQCDGGTLVLNITKSIPIDIQYTLIELTTGNSFADPLTGSTIDANVRFIVTTKITLKEFLKRHEVLPELLNLIKRRHLEIPPLRERPEDIPALVRYATKRARETGKSQATGADAQVLALFRHWNWPGNAEDLLLITAEACLRAKSELISLEDLPQEFISQIPEDLLEAARLVRASSNAPKALEAHTHAEELEDENPSSAESLAPNEDGKIMVDANRYRRLLTLARRLNSQSEILSRQMTGPLSSDLSDVIPSAGDAAAQSNGLELQEALESQLDKSLDSIMGLRRQLALLNEREQKTIETARDLYRRLILAGKDTQSLMEDEEIQEETAELAHSLRQMDEVIQRVSGSFPKLGKELENKVGNSIAKEEAELIAKALKRNRERVNPIPGVGSAFEDSLAHQNEEITIKDLMRLAQESDANMKEINQPLPKITKHRE